MKYTHKSKQILLAAKDVFSEKGFDGASTKEIAQAAGANEVTLFRHFQTKNNLFEEVVANFFIQPTLHYLKENDKTNLYDSLEQRVYPKSICHILLLYHVGHRDLILGSQYPDVLFYL